MSRTGSDPLPAYAELHCISNFTFLRGASHPEELVRRAAKLGYRALALTDECSVAGIVRAHVAARNLDIQLIVGSEFFIQDDHSGQLHIVLLAKNRRGYGQLCELITLGRRASEKGQYHLSLDNLRTGLDDCLALWIPGHRPDASAISRLAGFFPGRIWMALELLAMEMPGHGTRNCKRWAR